MILYTSTLEEALKAICFNTLIYKPTAATAPSELIKALTRRGSEFRDIEICPPHTEGDAPYADPALPHAIHINSFFHTKTVIAQVNPQMPYTS